MKCEECRWWIRYKYIDRDRDDVEGRCRRYPPQYILEQGLYWPKTAEDDWCGEYTSTDKELREYWQKEVNKMGEGEVES
jgi:hypothetical protein